MSSGEPSRGMIPRLATSAGRLSANRRLPIIAAVLAVFLTLPALGVGWMLDDYYHRSVLLGNSQLRDLLGPPSEMFRFFRGDPVRTGRVMDVGLFPWWTDPSIKGEFLQALTVLTHRLDYALWPNSPALMHAQSLLWLGAAVAVAAAFYRRILGPTWVAGVAALLFALDDTRGATVGWLANRNVLVAATFGVSALIAHDRWRRDGSRPAALLAPMLLLAALFSKEEGIGTCAYLASYALFVDPRGRRSGGLALWPYVVAVVGWAVLRASWGYGVHDMGLYIDPLTDAGRFATAVSTRLPILLLGQWSPIQADLATVLRPSMFAGLWWLASAFLGLLAFAAAPLLRRDRVACFWAAGMLFASIPVCATAPMDRLLTFVGIGASGLLAQFVAFVFGGAVGGPSSASWRVTARTLAWFLVVVHAIFAPISLPFRAANPVGPGWVEARFYVQTPLGPSLEDRTVVIVNAPSAVNATYLVLRREQSGLSVPRHTWVLAPAMPSATIHRLDERTLAIRPQKGYLRWPLDQVFRSERRPFALGDQVRLTGMIVTITDLTADGRPAEATFRFDVPLESPSLLWLCFQGDGFEPFTPPAVGQDIEIQIDWKALLSPVGRTGRTTDKELSNH
ncbi:MAG: hypothetical protein P4L85_23400 [Paludisphaera borealis]|uniref:hypothetical protein n=1 Tax=Paludisphaera borealis TaxID=1387353 RepID=UPI00284E6AA5|nr:hypothetical protein [Paludisphaera borealis]MDR3622317.1 hypothetical protein [Paludisphaera borealis]